MFNVFLKAPKKRPVFYTWFNMTYIKKDSKSIADRLYIALDRIQPVSRIVSIITDNSPNVLRISNKLNSEKGMHTESFGCCSYIFNLLFEHMIKKVPLIATITNDLKEMTISIEGTTSTKSLFNDICLQRGQTMIVFPRVILQRWSTNIRVYRSFQDNETIFKEFAAQSSSSKYISLLNNNYWCSIKNICGFFEIIYSGLVKSQNDACTQVDIYLIINGIKKSIEEYSYDKVDKQLILNIFKEIDIHFRHDLINAAYFLDPRFRGRGLSISEIDVCTSIITKLSGCDHRIIAEFGIWKHKEISTEFTWSMKDGLTSVSWWEHFGKYLPVLYSVFNKLCSIAISSSSVERSFSTQSIIHNKYRLNLKPENVEYLMNIKFNNFIMRDQMSEETINKEQRYEDLIEMFEEDVDYSNLLL